MPRIKWTEEEESILRNLVDRKVMLDMICKVLGRNENSIRAKALQLGMMIPTPQSKIDYELYRELMQPVEI